MEKFILVEDAVLRDTFWNAAIDLKKENDALKDRIKRLEAVTNDPHALWANWLLGTVALPDGIGDVRQYQARIKRLEDRIDLLMSANADVARIAGERDKAEKRVLYLETALRRIANTDYRGNRSTESQIAFEALKESQ
jgi:hypothetical protein